MECMVKPLRPQWKAQCYAFRARRPRVRLAFGGPLLEAPDRQVQTSAAAASSSPPRGIHRRRMHLTNSAGIPLTRSRCASRVQGRARACGPGDLGQLQRVPPRLGRDSTATRRHFQIRHVGQGHRGQSSQGRRDVSTTFRDVCNVLKRPAKVLRMARFTRPQCGRLLEVPTAFRDV